MYARKREREREREKERESVTHMALLWFSRQGRVVLLISPMFKPRVRDNSS